MDNIKFPKTFCLEDFIEGFVLNAVEIVRGEEKVSSDSFYDTIFARLSQEHDISIESVKHLHHSFHWGLFCENKDFFDYSQLCSSNDHGHYVRLKKIPADTEIKHLSDSILQNHGDYMRAKINKANAEYDKESNLAAS